MNKKFVVHARVLKAMSDENRLRILDLLREREYNASELLDEMDFGQSTLSHVRFRFWAFFYCLF